MDWKVNYHLYTTTVLTVPPASSSNDDDDALENFVESKEASHLHIDVPRSPRRREEIPRPFHLAKVEEEEEDKEKVRELMA